MTDARRDDPSRPATLDEAMGLLDVVRDERAAAHHFGQAICHRIRNTLTISAMAADIASATEDRDRAVSALERIRDSTLGLEPTVAVLHRYMADELAAGAGAAASCDLARAAEAALSLGALALARGATEVRRDLRPAPARLAAQDALALLMILTANAALACGSHPAPTRAPLFSVATTSADGVARLTVTLPLDALDAEAGAAALSRGLADVASRLSMQAVGDASREGLPALGGARAIVRAARGGIALASEDGALRIDVTIPST